MNAALFQLVWFWSGAVLAALIRCEGPSANIPDKDDGTPACGIVLDPELVTTRPQPRRAFQGWRYLEVADAPADARALASAEADIPPGMREELRELRLIDW